MNSKDDEMKDDEAYEQNAVLRFLELVDSFGGNWIAAKEWQHEIYNTRGDDRLLEYSLGLPRFYFKDVAKKQLT